jgi:thermitase
MMLLSKRFVSVLALALSLCPALSLGAVEAPAKTAQPKATVAKAKAAPKAAPKKVSAKEPALRNWGLDNSEAPSHIEAKRAWKITQGSRNVIVAVIDTGIDANHPDLKDNLWRKPGDASVYGHDFVFNKKNPEDTNGHGTHIAGIIGATRSTARGAVGVSPRVTIMPIRYYADENTDTDTVANIVKAIDFAIENGAQIINFSSEGTGFNVAEYRAIERASKKGILVITAAGNQGQNNDNAATPCYPASYDLPNILSVAATNIHNNVLPVSNYGPNKVHVAAPGEHIFSTLPKGRYGYNTGTSQATAFVTGVAALMLAENPSLKPLDLKKIIMSTVDKQPSLKDKVASGGRLNAFKALALAVEMKNASLPKREVAQTAN